MSKDPNLSPPERRRFDEQIARRLGALAQGDPADPETWRRVARKLRCRVDIYRDPDAGAFGAYVPDPEALGTGLITLNTAQPTVTQVRVLVKLLAEHLAHWWIPEEGEAGEASRAGEEGAA